MLDDNEITQTTTLLAKLQPGFVPYPIFEQLARIIALPILEIVPLRRGADGNTEVLLIERPANDPIWPGGLHTPGTVVRATDLNTAGSGGWPALERLLHDELHDTVVGQPQFIGSLLHQSKRGVEQAQLYWVEVTGEPQVGQFYPVDPLPEQLIESQQRFIVLAAERFAKQQT